MGATTERSLLKPGWHKVTFEYKAGIGRSKIDTPVLVRANNTYQAHFRVKECNYGSGDCVFVWVLNEHTGEPASKKPPW
jgi:hypothetical protein